MLYVLSLADYEDYEPSWFECDCSKELFKAAVEASIDFATHFIIEIEQTDKLIGYHELIEIVKQQLQDTHGFKLIKADYEIYMNGACFYDEIKDKPDVISKSSWKKIIKHNNQIRDGLYEDLK